AHEGPCLRRPPVAALRRAARHRRRAHPLAGRALARGRYLLHGVDGPRPRHADLLADLLRDRAAVLLLLDPAALPTRDAETRLGRLLAHAGRVAAQQLRPLQGRIERDDDV